MALDITEIKVGDKLTIEVRKGVDGMLLIDTTPTLDPEKLAQTLAMLFIAVMDADQLALILLLSKETENVKLLNAENLPPKMLATLFRKVAKGMDTKAKEADGG